MSAEDSLDSEPERARRPGMIIGLVGGDEDMLVKENRVQVA